MRNLFLIMFSFLVFAACSKQDAVISESPQIEETVAMLEDKMPEFVQSSDPLVYEIQKNSNFLSYARYLDLRKGEIKAFMVENDAAIRADIAVLKGFVTGFAKYEEDIFEYYSKLNADFPQLAKMDNVASVNIVHSALKLRNGQVEQGKARSCWDVCHDAYLDRMDYYYALYLDCMDHCILHGGDYNYCNDKWYDWFRYMNARYNVPAFDRCLDNC